MASLSLIDMALACLSIPISGLPRLSLSNQASPSVPSGPRLSYTSHYQQHLIVRSQLECLLRQPFLSSPAKNGPDLRTLPSKPLISLCVALTVLEIIILSDIFSNLAYQNIRSLKAGQCLYPVPKAVQGMP